MSDPQPDEPVLISALNHYAFCPRRCALIHVDGVRGENAYMLEGLLIHRRSECPIRYIMLSKHGGSPDLEALRFLLPAPRP